MSWNPSNLRSVTDEFGSFAKISYGDVEKNGINDDEWEWLINGPDDFMIRIDKAFTWDDQTEHINNAIEDFLETGWEENLLNVLQQYRIPTKPKNFKEFDIEWV